MIEKEYKYLVNKDEFDAVQREIQTLPYKEKRQRVQTNHYYDTATFTYKKNKITVRIREVEGRCFLQTKTAKKSREAYKTSVETKREIESIPKQLSYDELGLKENKGVAVDETLEYQGKLQTKRTSYVFESGVKVEFDTSEYLGTKDYEIEVEFEQIEPQTVLKTIEKHVQKRKSIGKHKRFLMAKTR